MYSAELKVRVRYSETDRMGYVYYGNYAQYYEIGRVETFRSLGFTYKELEDSGINLPVLDLKIKYIKPAVYDDLLTVKTTITQMPEIRIHFKYEISNEEEILNVAETTLVFFNTQKRKPCTVPDWMRLKLQPFFT